MNTFVILYTQPNGLDLTPEQKAQNLADVVSDDFLFLRRESKDVEALARCIGTITEQPWSRTIRSFRLKKADEAKMLAKTGDRVIVLKKDGWEQYRVS